MTTLDVRYSIAVAKYYTLVRLQNTYSTQKRKNKKLYTDNDKPVVSQSKMKQRNSTPSTHNF